MNNNKQENYYAKSIVFSVLSLILSCGCLGVSLVLAIMALVFGLAVKDQDGKRSLNSILCIIVAVTVIIINLLYMGVVIVNIIENGPELLKKAQEGL